VSKKEFGLSNFVKLIDSKNKNLKEKNNLPKPKIIRCFKKRLRLYNRLNAKHFKLYRIEQFLSKYLKEMFGFIFIVKFIQLLNKVISSKIAMKRLGFKTFNFLYRYYKLKHFKRIVRFSLDSYRYNNLYQITEQLRKLLEIGKLTDKTKKQEQKKKEKPKKKFQSITKKNKQIRKKAARRFAMYYIKFAKELFRATKGYNVKSYKLIVKGKLKKMRAITYSIDYNGIP